MDRRRGLDLKAAADGPAVLPGAGRPLGALAAEVGVLGRNALDSCIGNFLIYKILCDTEKNGCKNLEA